MALKPTLQNFKNEPKSGNDQRQPWLTVGLLFACGCLNYADRTAISAVFPLLRTEFGMSDVELAGLGSFFLWSYALCSPLAGLAADRFRRSRLIVGSLFAWSLVTMATGLAASVNQLFLARMLLGVAECLYLPAAVAFIADHHSQQTRGRALGLHLCGLNLGLVAGGGLAGYLGDHAGWRQSFFILGAAGMALAVVCSFLLNDVQTTAKAKPLESVAQLRKLLSKPLYLLLLIEAMLVAVGTWMFFNWMPLYFQETFHLSLAVAGLSGTVPLQISAVIGLLLGSVLSDVAAKKHDANRLLLMAVFYLLSAPLLLVFVTNSSMAIVTVAVVLFAFFRAVGAANDSPVLCDMQAPEDRSTAQGLFNMLNALAGGLGIFAAGYLKKDFGLGGVFAGVTGIMMMAALVAFAASVVRRRTA